MTKISLSRDAQNILISSDDFHSRQIQNEKLIFASTAARVRERRQTKFAAAPRGYVRAHLSLSGVAVFFVVR
jgi:hypothetical protein